MLLYFLIPCFSVLLFSNSLNIKILPPWANEARLFLLNFLFKCLKDLSFLTKTILSYPILTQNTSDMSPKKALIVDHSTTSEEEEEMSVLDLPELVIECVLEKLPPSGLCSMAGVCRSMREKCVSDHLWERHMNQKWGKVIGSAAYKEWKWHIASTKNTCNLKQGKRKALMKLLSLVRPFSWIQSNFGDDGEEDINNKQRNSLQPVDSIMSWYLALETGSFWFPAQVYNRENGHVGFIMSCYDAELSYDAHTDTFQARYPPHGRRAVAIENGLTWDRLRAPPVDTPPHDLHVSDCLNELRPGDHIEIQWRRNKEFPYGWWYGVVGHLESCHGNENYCQCHLNEEVGLEFNQYTIGSRWRCTKVNRKDHREEGNEADGFYGGIRKLKTEVEINTWKRLWPTAILE